MCFKQNICYYNYYVVKLIGCYKMHNGMVFCSNCGHSYEQNNNFCSRCGAVNITKNIVSSNNIYSVKSNLVAFLLCFVIGYLGMHRFYVGKTSSAVIQLLLTISILFSLVSIIWVFIDLIVIALQQFKDNENKILKW